MAKSARSISCVTPSPQRAPLVNKAQDSFGCLLYMPFVVGPPRSDITDITDYASYSYRRCCKPETGENAASPPRSVIVILF